MEPAQRLRSGNGLTIGRLQRLQRNGFDQVRARHGVVTARHGVVTAGATILKPPCNSKQETRNGHETAV